MHAGEQLPLLPVKSSPRETLVLVVSYLLRGMRTSLLAVLQRAFRTTSSVIESSQSLLWVILFGVLGISIIGY